MKTFAARLRTAREAKGYPSAQRFAGVLGFEPHTYRKYERGAAEPNFDVLMRICEVLDVTADYLLPRLPPTKTKRPVRNGNGQEQSAA